MADELRRSPDYPSWAEDIARRFHEEYERLAPSFGYETRRESAGPWEDVPEANRLLMTATVAAALSATMSLDPIDCSGDCYYAPCNCSGERRVRGVWLAEPQAADNAQRQG